MSKTFRQSWADERRVRLTKGYSRIASVLAAADAKLRQQREMRQHAADRKQACSLLLVSTCSAQLSAATSDHHSRQLPCNSDRPAPGFRHDILRGQDKGKS